MSRLTIEIYTKTFCPYCRRIRELLHMRGILFTEHDICNEPARERELLARSRSRSVPAVFIDGRLIGGCSELFALDEHGELDRLITPRPAGFA